MVTLNILETLAKETKEFFLDMKNGIINIFASIHYFLNQYMSDNVLTAFLIVILAFIFILIFRAIINRR